MRSSVLPNLLSPQSPPNGCVQPSNLTLLIPSWWGHTGSCHISCIFSGLPLKWGPLWFLLSPVQDLFRIRAVHTLLTVHCQHFSITEIIPVDPWVGGSRALRGRARQFCGQFQGLVGRDLGLDPHWLSPDSPQNL